MDLESHNLGKNPTRVGHVNLLALGAPKGWLGK